MLLDNTPIKSPLDKAVMSLSAFSIQGKRNHMEDYFDIGYQMKPRDQRKPGDWPYEYFYFGIFDGHGGHEAANFAKQHLLKFITNQKDFWSNDDEDVMRSIRKGYADTHSAMRREMHKWSRASSILPSTAGTTASVLFIRNGKFYTGHVGDSRIVVGQENAETGQWISRQVTDDHKPESEVDRIQRAGGEVKNKLGVNRVVWRRPLLNCLISSNITSSRSDPPRFEDMTTYPIDESKVYSYQTIPFLAIGRSLGDFWSINPISGQYVVSPEPDVTCRPVHEDDRCILLATDGLWNVINSSAAVRFLQELYISKTGKRRYHEEDYFASDNFYDVAGEESENHAQSIVYFAYQIWERRRLRSDNITVVVAMLHEILDYFHSTAKTKPYHTRASVQSFAGIREKVHNNDNKPEKEPKMVQLARTNCFVEKIKLQSEPEFNPKGEPILNERWQRLESFLILPPTILEQERDFKYPKLTYPKNYTRLSNASCRKLPIVVDEPDSPRRYEWNVLIKKVSDDPADEQERPTRIGRLGKEVKDSSCQATQTIHDFGQPWDQLLDEERHKARVEREALDKAESKPEEEYEDEDDVELDDESDEEGEDKGYWDDSDSSDHDSSEEEYELVHISEVKIGDEVKLENIEYVIRHDDDADHDELLKSGDIKSSHKRSIRLQNFIDYFSLDSSVPKSLRLPPAPKEDEAIPKLRCLMNHTPPLRRSARHSYVSVSDNSKRKAQMNSVQASPKSKRRKSHPVRCSVRAR